MRLIDADALIIHIVKKYGLTEVILDIDEMPTIEVVSVKHGRWINGKCSECGCEKVITKVVHNGEVAWISTYRDNYCPNCGTKMDLEEVEV